MPDPQYGPQYILPENRGTIAVSGADARAFLQGLISNDMRAVSSGRAIYAALLTPQGRFLHDFFISQEREIFYLDCEARRLDDLIGRLTRYRLRSEVMLEAATGDRVVALLFGAGALASLELPDEPGVARPFAGGVAYTDPRAAAAGARAVLPRADAAAELEAVGFAAGDGDAYERLRLELGLPDGSRDLEVEKALLLESGFDEINGIDWDKGCYVGQELTARMKYRGLVKKRLVPVSVAGPLPEAGTPVMAGGAEIGQLRSGHGEIALALLRVDAPEGPFEAGSAKIAPLASRNAEPRFGR